MKAPLEVQPGELVALKESEELGVQVSKVREYLDGLYVIENMRTEMNPHQYAELEFEVGYIRAAKQGRVRIQIAWDLEFKPLHLLTEEDQLFTKAITEEGLAMVYLGSRYADVPLDELSPEAVDDELLETLEFYTSESMGPYVIEDSEKARHALDKRLAEE